jgi:hypothetical protein
MYSQLRMLIWSSMYLVNIIKSVEWSIVINATIYIKECKRQSNIKLLISRHLEASYTFNQQLSARTIKFWEILSRITFNFSIFSIQAWSMNSKSCLLWELEIQLEHTKTSQVRQNIKLNLLLWTILKKIRVKINIWLQRWQKK